MPTYAYVCDACGEREDIVKPMAESTSDETCRACGRPMRKDLTTSTPRVHKDSYSKPLHSDALAIHPEQRAEHQRLYPDVRLDRANRPILDSFAKAERYYNSRGIHKPMKRNRRRMARIG